MKQLWWGWDILLITPNAVLLLILNYEFGSKIQSDIPDLLNIIQILVTPVGLLIGRNAAMIDGV